MGVAFFSCFFLSFFPFGCSFLSLMFLSFFPLGCSFLFVFLSFVLSFFLLGRGCTAVADFLHAVVVSCFFLSVRWGVDLQLSLFDSFFPFG